MLTIILVVIIILLVIGLGWDGFYEALKKGWDSVPAEKVTDNFKDAAIESIKDVRDEVEERAEEPTIDDLKVEEDIFKNALDGLKVDFKGDD
jgi:hypothetical protein